LAVAKFLNRVGDSSVCRRAFVLVLIHCSTSQRLVDKLGPVPLHDKVTPFVFPSRRIVFVPYRAVQYVIAAVHADDQRSEVRVIVIVIVEVDAQPDNGGSENGKGLPPSIPASNIDFDLMGVSGGAINTLEALLSAQNSI
jgi:hypothetical protein